MKKGILLFFCWACFFPWMSVASPTANLKAGDKTAQNFLTQLEAKKREAGHHPFYAGHSNAAQLKDSDLKGKAQSLHQSDPVSQMLHHSTNSRPQVKIDPSKDSLMTGSQEIMASPLQVIGGEGTYVMEVQQGGTNEIVVCEEAGDDAKYTCHLNLLVIIKEELWPIQQGSFSIGGPAIYTSYGYLLNRWPRERRRHFVGYIQVDQSTLKAFISSQTGIPVTQILSASASPVGERIHVSHKRYTFEVFQFNYSYQPRIKVPYDSWMDGCKALEERVDQGLCHYDTKECTQGPQTRIIEGIPITKACWEEKLTYACDFPTKDDCGPLRARGCVQINSVCKQSIGNTCVAYTQTYQCRGESKNSYHITGGNTPFCLDGNCRDQSWEANDEMMSSIAQLSLLKDMQGKFNSIFEGKEHQCSKHIMSFKDCCGSGKGWGKSLGLGGCDDTEKILQKKRQARLCHYVGTYCAKKKLGVCIKKKSSFCCFGSKLLKAFQEQGRQQIGLGWGAPKHPLCRGFTIEEIQRIDFSKLDLREAFEDLMKNYTPDKIGNMSPTAEKKIETTDLDKVGQEILHKSQATQVQDVSKRVGERVEILKKVRHASH